MDAARTKRLEQIQDVGTGPEEFPSPPQER
jgi:hypothetical protein